MVEQTDYEDPEGLKHLLWEIEVECVDVVVTAAEFE